LAEGNGARGAQLSADAERRARRNSRIIVAIILGFPMLFFVFSGFRAVQIARDSEVPEAFRDLNCDGQVSFAEWLRGGIDFVVKPSASVPGCQDLIHIKSQRAVVTRCEQPPVCRLAAGIPK
jgi:hypothetical protein